MKSIISVTSMSLVLCAGASVAAPHTPPAIVVAETAQFEWDRVAGTGNGDAFEWESVPADDTTWAHRADAITNPAARQRPAYRTAPRAELKKTPLSAVPEPSIASMLLVGLIVLTLAGQSQKDEKFSS